MNLTTNWKDLSLKESDLMKVLCPLLEEEVPTELKVLLDLDLVAPTSLINTPLKIPPPAALVEGVSLR
jgi:hypothetical protein